MCFLYSFSLTGWEFRTNSLQVFLPIAILTIAATAIVVVVVEILPRNVKMIIHTASTIPNTTFSSSNSGFLASIFILAKKIFLSAAKQELTIIRTRASGETSFLNVSSIFLFSQNQTKRKFSPKRKRKF